MPPYSIAGWGLFGPVTLPSSHHMQFVARLGVSRVVLANRIPIIGHLSPVPEMSRIDEVHANCTLLPIFYLLQCIVRQKSCVRVQPRLRKRFRFIWIVIG